MPTIENPPPPQPPSRGLKPGPSPERMREQLLSFLVLLLGLIIVSQLPLPFRLGGLVLAVVTGWVGLRLLLGLVTLRRAGHPVRGRPSVIIGLGLTVVLALILAIQAAFYPIVVQRERCLSGANTQTATDSCDRHYRDRLSDLEDDFRTRTDRG